MRAGQLFGYEEGERWVFEVRELFVIRAAFCNHVLASIGDHDHADGVDVRADEGVIKVGGFIVSGPVEGWFEDDFFFAIDH